MEGGGGQERASRGGSHERPRSRETVDAATAIASARRFNSPSPSLGFPLAHRGWKYPGAGGGFEGDAGRVRARRGARVRGRGADRAPDGDAVLGHGVVGVVEQVAGVQERLGRDAPDVQAGASEGAATLDARHLEAELSALDGGDVAAGAAADDDDVLLLARGGVPARADGAKRRGRERGRERARRPASDERLHRDRNARLTIRGVFGAGRARDGTERVVERSRFARGNRRRRGEGWCLRARSSDARGRGVAPVVRGCKKVRRVWCPVSESEEDSREQL